jgi:hypothetical protein
LLAADLVGQRQERIGRSRQWSLLLCRLESG